MLIDDKGEYFRVKDLERQPKLILSPRAAERAGSGRSAFLRVTLRNTRPPPSTMRSDRMLICLAALIFAGCGSKRPAAAAGDQPPQRCCCNHVDRDDEGVVPEPEPRKVLLVTEDNLYLEGAMLTIADLEVIKLTPAEYAADPEHAYSEVQVVVFDDYTPKEVPPVHAIYFHPDQAGSPIPVSGTNRMSAYNSTHAQRCGNEHHGVPARQRRVVDHQVALRATTDHEVSNR